MDHIELFYKRLNQAFEECFPLTKAELARKVDISQPYLFKILKGLIKSSIPPADVVLKLANALNVNYEWLVTGEAPKNTPQNNSQPKYSMVSESVPNISIHNGTVYFDDTYKNHSILTKQEAEIQDKLKKILIPDDAMSPLIRKGDYVLIYSYENLEKSFYHVKSGKIYAFFVDHELYCRRLYKQLDGSIVVKAENKDYVEGRFTKEELDDRFIIVGQVLKRHGYVE